MLAFETNDLDRAQKTFRALLLQRLGREDAGISKGEVFCYLGRDQREAGRQGQKASADVRARGRGRPALDHRAKTKLAELKSSVAAVASRAVLELKLLGALARVSLTTLRVGGHGRGARLDDAGEGASWNLAFWHGAQWPLLAWRRRGPTVVMVSTLAQMEAMQAVALGMQGLTTSRDELGQGARALAAMVRAMRREGAGAAFAASVVKGSGGREGRRPSRGSSRRDAMVVPMTGRVRAGHRAGEDVGPLRAGVAFTRVDVVLGELSRPDAPRRARK